MSRAQAFFKSRSFTSMLSRRTAMGLGLAAAAAVGARAVAQDDDAEKVKVPKYKPMGRGAPGGRIGGATRGTPPESLKMLALAPDHVGYAAQAQPVLYWYLSDPIDGAVFTIKPADGSGAVMKKDLTGPLAKGVQAVSVAELGISLEPEKVYEWSISLAADQPKDISALSRGLVAVRAASSKVTKQAAKAKPEALPELYAENGYWYDAIDGISRLIAANPAVNSYKLIRAGMVEQVKLFDVADFDRGVM
ncbi:MAG: DUF928 domain-containing protein [Rhodospirillaceae bacterium]|nr:DUF928 domain-containing protein [Rhodospirillaceae bacterium]